jgi:signal transduction histidine kinase
VAAHHGEIAVESVVGQGSKFIVKLPINEEL